MNFSNPQNCSTISEIGQAPIFILLGVICLVVIVGNSLVIAVIVLDRKLQTITNLFIVSLATADLLIGIFVLPFSIGHEFLGYKVFLNSLIWCQLWVATDIWLCTASIYNLVAISFDRYLAITKALKYAGLVTKEKVIRAIFGVWILSFFICCPIFVPLWSSDYDYLLKKQQEACFCSTLNSDPVYIIYSASGSFFVPTAIIIFVYWRIYTSARNVERKHEKRKSRLTIKQKDKVVLAQSFTFFAKNRQGEKKATQAANTTAPARPKSISTCTSSMETAFCEGSMAASSSCSEFSQNLNVPASSSPRVFRDRAERLFTLRKKDSFFDMIKQKTLNPRFRANLKTEIRAAKTVAIVTGCFIVCWLGFSVVYFMQAIPSCYSSDCISRELFTVVTWLGYCNSAVNPFLYAILNSKFRKGLANVLTCRKRNRENFSL